MPEECRSCSTEIWWAHSLPDGQGQEKSNPINHATLCTGSGANCTHEGNLAVWRDEQQVLRYRYLKKGEALNASEHRAVSHFATCANADQWRSRQKKANGNA